MGPVLTCLATKYVSTTDTPGNYGTSACTDPSINTDMAACTAVTGYSISTLQGFATCTPNTDCGTVGAICGTLDMANGYQMACTALSDDFNVDCGEYWACNTFMQCVGVQTDAVCP